MRVIPSPFPKTWKTKNFSLQKQGYQIHITEKKKSKPSYKHQTYQVHLIEQKQIKTKLQNKAYQVHLIEVSQSSHLGLFPSEHQSVNFVLYLFVCLSVLWGTDGIWPK